MAKLFPKTLYVVPKKLEDDEYLECGEYPAGLAEHNEVVIAGKYELVAEVKITNQTFVSEPGQ